MFLLKTTSLKGNHCHHRLVVVFFPERRDLRNHMYRASVKLPFSKIDQENLSMKVDIWKKEKAKDTFYFRPYGNDQHLPCPEQLFFSENGGKISDVSFR